MTRREGCKEERIIWTAYVSAPFVPIPGPYVWGGRTFRPPGQTEPRTWSLPWVDPGDVQRSWLQPENILGKKHWATVRRISKMAQEDDPETAQIKPQDGPRGSQEAANKAQEGPLFDQFAPGLPWCRGARSPTRGPRGPAKIAREHPSFDQFAAGLPRCWGA